MEKILVVDDEHSILTLLKFNLEKEGYEVTSATDGQVALDIAKQKKFDFIVLDLMLPSMDGIEITKKLRQEKVETPILMLTAKDDAVDKIVGLEIGADDYMTKPFSPRELIARIRAIKRRTSRLTETAAPEPLPQDDMLKVGELTLYPQRYEAFLEGSLLDLTPKEFELLLYFIQRKNRVLDRDTLLNAVWNYDFSGETRIVDVHVSHLREKIEEDPKHPRYIVTVRGFGYKLKEPNE